MTRSTGISTSAASHGHMVAWLHDPLVITFGEPPHGGDLDAPLLAVPVISARDMLAPSRAKITVIDDVMNTRR